MPFYSQLGRRGEPNRRSQANEPEQVSSGQTPEGRGCEETGSFGRSHSHIGLLSPFYRSEKQPGEGVRGKNRKGARGRRVFLGLS